MKDKSNANTRGYSFDTSLNNTLAIIYVNLSNLEDVQTKCS